MRSIRTWLCAGIGAVCMLAPVCSLHAEVFSLWPFRDGAAKPSAGTVSESLQPRRFWTEPIFVNGMPLELNISLMDADLQTVAERMKASLDKKTASLFASKNSLFIQQAQPDGTVDRMYYLHIPGVKSLLEFRIKLPADRKAPDKRDFPKELPMLTGADELTFMIFPSRKATYGAYRVQNTTLPQVLGDVSGQLKSMGWEPVARESDNVFEGRGEVFLRENPSSILILGTSQEKNGRGVRVSMYTRPL